MGKQIVIAEAYVFPEQGSTRLDDLAEGTGQGFQTLALSSTLVSEDLASTDLKAVHAHLMTGVPYDVRCRIQIVQDVADDEATGGE